MSRAPRLNSKQLISALAKAGFVTVRVRGSHHFLRHPDGRATVVPLHAGETVGVGLLVKVLRDADVSIQELIDLLT